MVGYGVGWGGVGRAVLGRMERRGTLKKVSEGAQLGVEQE